jgi:hypothetical protein
MLWERNVFAQWVPWIGQWMESGFVRGGVTGVGLVTAVAGLRDLATAFIGRTGTPIAGTRDSGP